MIKDRWHQLSPRVRRALIITGAIEGALKVAALVDLGRRRQSEVRGSRKVWAVAIVLVNSAGAVPIGYFLKGRRPAA